MSNLKTVIMNSKNYFVSFKYPGVINNPCSFSYKVWLIFLKKNKYRANYSYLTQNMSEKVVGEVYLESNQTSVMELFCKNS